MSWPLLVNAGLVLALHQLWLYVFVSRLGLALLGIALATALSYALDALLAYLELHCLAALQPARQPLARSDFAGWQPLLRTALLTVAMESAEWWALAALPLLATPLGPAPMAAMTLLSSIESTFELLSYGLQDSIQTFVGAALGEGRPRLARRVAFEIALLSLLVAAAGATAVVLLGDSLFALLVSNEEVVRLAAQCLPVLLVELLADQLQLSSGALVRGLNQLGAALVVRSLSYYLLFLPGVALAVALHLPLWVVMLMLASTSVLIVVADLIVLARCDWEAIALEAMKDASEDTALTECLILPSKYIKEEEEDKI